jgi:hypothetical protein
MSRQTSDIIGAFMAGFVIGGLTGAALMLLFSPRREATPEADIISVLRHNQPGVGKSSTESAEKPLPRIILDNGNGAVGLAATS